MKNYLEFEKDIKTLEDEMELLKNPGNQSISEVDTNKIKSTQDQINSKLKSIYSNLNSWQKTQVARHEDRPRASFYIRKIFNNFTPLAGDRYFGDDQSVTTGFGLINEKLWLGHFDITSKNGIPAFRHTILSNSDIDFLHKKLETTYFVFSSFFHK